jgi:hypothetical protein
MRYGKKSKEDRQRERVLISMDLKNLTDYRNEVKGTGIANILPVPVFSPSGQRKASYLLFL